MSRTDKVPERISRQVGTRLGGNKRQPENRRRYPELLRIHVRPRIGAKLFRNPGRGSEQAILTASKDRMAHHQACSPRAAPRVRRCRQWGSVKRNVVALVDAPKVQRLRPLPYR